MEPPFFDGKNYPEWKIKMEHFIKAILGMKSWILIVNGWSPPILEDGKGKRITKPFKDWTESECEICTLNSRALNAIFGSIGQQPFKWIAFCDTAKEAWETLRTVYEETGRLREEAQLILETRFSTLEMEEHETISSYCERLVDITYEAGTLGRTFSNDELVNKVIWSLPYRFGPMVAAISEHSKGLKLGDLIGSLKAYEKKLERRAKENNKMKREFGDNRFGHAATAL